MKKNFLIILILVSINARSEVLDSLEMGVNSIYFNTLENRQNENSGHSIYNYISTNLFEGVAYNFYINVYGEDHFSNIWIDFNGDNIFNENEKINFFINGNGAYTIFQIKIPYILKNEKYKIIRLRIKTEYFYLIPTNIDDPNIESCYGEIFDYYVKILPNNF